MYSTCSTAGITLFFNIALDVVSPWVELLFVCCKNIIVNREAALEAEDPLEKTFPVIAFVEDANLVCDEEVNEKLSMCNRP